MADSLARSRVTFVFRASLLMLALPALAACSGVGGFSLSDSSSAAAPAQPAAVPADLAGRWMLSSPGRGQCRVTLGAPPNATEGTVAPEGGCPGKFFTSRKWSYEQGGIVLRDHNGKVLAQFAGNGNAFSGQAATGEPVTLSR